MMNVRQLFTSLRDVTPSTVIRITGEDFDRLQRLIPLHGESLPSDIIEADIVPIRSLSIDLDWRPDIPFVQRCDVFVIYGDFDNAALAIFMTDQKTQRRGMNIAYIDNGKLYLKVPEQEEKPEGFDTYLAVNRTVINAWYRIQVALLHPTIKEVFRHSGIMSDADREESKDYKKRPLYYQKVKTINQREFDEAVKRNIVRKTLIWYVIGHWRNYKDGRRIFIQPYWKGALRETKMTEVPRERVI